MAGRVATRYVSRRSSSGGKVLSEEEKAAENVYIKKMEKERLEKKAREGPKSDTQATGSGTPVTEGVKASGPEAAAPKTSTDKKRNYAVVAGVVTGLAALGWYYKSESKKVEEVHD